MALSRSRLRELLHYDPKTGRFTWRVHHGRWGHIKAGTIAGDTNIRPTIHIDGKTYLVSRLAWLYMTGRWPRLTVDHRDCNQENNRWNNLRLATQQEQQRNRKGYSKTGFKGVYINRDGFAAYITIDKKSIYLGKRDTPEEAHRLFCEAAKQYGEFARLGHTRKTPSMIPE
jgi:hypothetical protein